MLDSAWEARLNQQIQELEDSGSLRQIPAIEAKEGNRVQIGGRWLLNLSSNDYLGLSRDTEFHQRFALDPQPHQKAFTLGLMGSTSSRLLGGHEEIYRLLEEELAAWLGRESALLFNSGYHANLGVLPALAGPGDSLLMDKYCHASLIDGARLSGARLERFRHGDLQDLEKLLKQRSRARGKVLVVTEGLFSMDGDEAPLEDLCRLKDRYGFFLLVDEAHSLGTLGPQGTGLCGRLKSPEAVDLVVGTFGKAFGSQGAFAAGTDLVKKVLINKARPFIFSTALPPYTVVWNRFVLSRMKTLEAARGHLETLARRFRQALREAGGDPTGSSPIIPLIMGSNLRALEASQALREAGFFIPAVRPPTVPPATSRLRVSLTAALTWEELSPLMTQLKEGKWT